MGRSSRVTRLLSATTAALVFVGFSSASHAATKKKKKKPAPSSTTTTAPTNGGEIDAPLAAPAEASPAVAAPPSAPVGPPATTPIGDTAEVNKETSKAPDTRGGGGIFAHIDGPKRLGNKHTLVIDDLSGFRASSIGGVSYAGVLGFSVQSFNESVPAPSGAAGGSDTFHFTTFWFAPSADYFLFDHLSVGLLFQIASTSGSYDQSLFGAASTSHSLPSSTDITFLPRVGWMFPFGDHWGLWPRVGLGYGSHAAASVAAESAGGATTSSDSYGAFLLDLDVGVVYRMTSMWFVRAAPELTFGPGSHSVQSGNTSVSLGASLVSFSVAGGFGFMWSL